MTSTPCLHRKAQDSRWDGRQDLFCKRPLGHDGNHLHDRHPDGSTFSSETGWLYGVQSAPDASIPTHEQRPAYDASGRPVEPPFTGGMVRHPDREESTLVLDSDHQSIPDSEVWSEETGETFGEARARFATFGPEVPATMVPALVEAGVMVWSFGYGDDPEDFTTIEASDLEGTDWSDPADTGVWAPFRLDVLTPDAERILAGVEPTVSPLGADEPFAPALEAAREAASLPSADSLLRRTVAVAVAGVPEDATNGEAADVILAALTREGFTILAASDLSWGECPDASDRAGEATPHEVSLSLCSGCLEYDPD